MADKKTSSGGGTLLYVGLGVGVLVLIGGGYLIYSHFFKKAPVMPAPAAATDSSQQSNGGDQYSGGGNGSGGYDQFGMGGGDSGGLNAGPEPYIDPSMLPGGNMPMPNNLLNSSNISVGTAPSGLMAGSVTGNSAVLSWQPAYGASSYTVQYQLPTDPGPTSLSTSGTSIQLSNLQPGQTYYCQVQSVTSGGASSFSPSISFVTPASGTSNPLVPTTASLTPNTTYAAGATPQGGTTPVGQTNTDVNNTGTVTLWSDCGFGGQAIELGVGRYDLPQLIALGYSNDTLSSLQIPAGRSATLYQDAGFKGASITFNVDVNCLTSYQLSAAQIKLFHLKQSHGKITWNDQMSSIVIS